MLSCCCFFSLGPGARSARAVGLRGGRGGGPRHDLSDFLHGVRADENRSSQNRRRRNDGHQ